MANERVPGRGLNDGLGAGVVRADARVHWNLVTPELVEAAVALRRRSARRRWPAGVETGPHTGRSVRDRYIVRDAETEQTVWWGKSNQAMTPAHFAALKADFLLALGEREELFVQDLHGGSQPSHRVKVRVINEFAWHNLFIRTMLVRPKPAELAGFAPDYTIIDLPASAPRPSAMAAGRRR